MAISFPTITLNRYAPYRAEASRPHLDYRFLNALLVKRQRETLNSGRYRKTDAIDLDWNPYCGPKAAITARMGSIITTNTQPGASKGGP
jgi:hypothetical protein